MSDFITTPLQSGDLTSDFAALYVPPANKVAEIKSLWIKNISASDGTFSIRFNFAGSAKAWLVNIPLGAGESAELIDEAAIGLRGASQNYAGDTIEGAADANAKLNYNMFGIVGVQ